jgi:hypothetical protein
MSNSARNLFIVTIVALLEVVVCLNQSPGQGEAKRAAAKWEYMTYDTDAKGLNQYADLGWEVCAGYCEKPQGTNDFVGRVVLRRPKVSK